MPDDKLVGLVIDKIDNLESELEIEEFLKNQGLDVESRARILKKAKERMSSTTFNPDGDYSFGSKELKLEDQHSSGKIHQIESAKTPEDIKKEREFLESLGNIPKTGRSSDVNHERVPILWLVLNSLSMFFVDIHKFLSLFLLHLIGPTITFLIGYKLESDLIMGSMTTILVFFYSIFFVSLAKFMSNDDQGHLFSTKYAIIHFVPIYCTFGLISIVISTLVAFSVFVGIFATTFNVIFGVVLGLVLIGASLTIAIWYSLVFFVMVSEDEFYVSAIAKSRKYIKHKFLPYAMRMVVFLITYLIFIVLAIFILLVTIYFTNKVTADVFSYRFDIKSLLLFVSNLSNVVSITVAVVLAFFLFTWPMVFGHLLYRDFAMDSKYTDANLSMRHQNLFFIVLVLGSILGGNKASEFSKDVENKKALPKENRTGIFDSNDKLLEFNP